MPQGNDHPDERSDPDQGHPLEWPSTPYSDEARESVRIDPSGRRVLLLGDCTVLCDYLPPANRPESHLRVRLRRAFPGVSFAVRNAAANGESAQDLIASGRLATVVAESDRIDAAFIRYGINDRKQSGIPACIDSLRQACQAILKTFPAAMIVLETGIWVDYPRHYLWDRNSRLEPLYLAVSELAGELQLPLLDVFGKMRRETQLGNWDLRVRGLPAPEHTIVDDSFDPYFADDPAFFTNIHPNSRCIGLIAQWQTELLRSLRWI